MTFRQISATDDGKWRLDRFQPNRGLIRQDGHMANDSESTLKER